MNYHHCIVLPHHRSVKVGSLSHTHTFGAGSPTPSPPGPAPLCCLGEKSVLDQCLRARGSAFECERRVSVLLGLTEWTVVLRSLPCSAESRHSVDQQCLQRYRRAQGGACAKTSLATNRRQRDHWKADDSGRCAEVMKLRGNLWRAARNPGVPQWTTRWVPSR